MKRSHPGVPVGEFEEEYLVKPSYDGDGVQVGSAIGKDGREYPDPLPLAPPVGFHAPDDLMTTIKKMVHHEEFNRRLDEEGFDTFEDAGDFDVIDDPPDPLTPHERLFMPPDEPPAPPAAVSPAPPPPDPGPAAPTPPPAPPNTST